MMTFPIPAEELLPHAGFMCCLDRLLEATHDDARAEVLLTPSHALMDGDTLHPSGFIELAAQTAGTIQGYTSKVLGEPVRKGYLVGAQDFVVEQNARVGDLLTIEVNSIAKLDSVSVLSARVSRNDETLAEGRIKVFTHEL